MKGQGWRSTVKVPVVIPWWGSTGVTLCGAHRVPSRPKGKGEMSKCMCRIGGPSEWWCRTAEHRARDIDVNDGMNGG